MNRSVFKTKPHAQTTPNTSHLFRPGHGRNRPVSTSYRSVQGVSNLLRSYEYRKYPRVLSIKTIFTTRARTSTRKRRREKSESRRNRDRNRPPEQGNVVEQSNRTRSRQKSKSSIVKNENRPSSQKATTPILTAISNQHTPSNASQNPQLEETHST